MNNSYRTICLIIISVVLVAHASYATDFYVDAENGNDDASGTSPSEAWQTLAKVSSTTFEPGDKVLFRAGSVWNERVQLNGSGEEGNPIILDQYDTGNKPIFNGGGGGVGTGDNGWDKEPTVLLLNEEYWEIRNLEITNTDGTLDTYQGNLWGIHVNVTEAGEYNHIYIENCYIHAVGSDVPEESHGGKDAGGISVTVESSRDDPAWYNDLQIRNNVIGGEKGGDLVGGVGISTQSTHGRLSHEPDRYPYKDFKIINNVVGPTGRNNVIVRVSDSVMVEHNTLRDAGQFSTGHNIFNFNCTNTIFQYNEAYGNVGPADDVDRGGFDADYNVRDTYIQYNYSHDNNWGFAWMKRGINENAVFRYNISENDRLHIYHYGFADDPGPQEAQAYNNTHYVSADFDVAVFSNRIPNNTTFRNNIFYFEGSGTWGEQEPDPSCIFENNAYYNLAPRGTDYITDDPKLIDKGTSGQDIDWSQYPNVLTGYKLQSISPCVDAGQVIADNGGQDFWGNSLYNGLPDIGAHEYISSGQSVPSAPSGLGATSISGSQIDLTWTDNSNDEDVFIIERKSTGAFITVGTVTQNETVFSDTDLEGLTTYTYRIGAHNGGGISSFSNESSATTDEGLPITKLYALEDAYVRGGDNSAIAFGTDNPTAMEIKTGSNPTFFRDALIKFDLSSYSDIADAKLFIYGSGQNSIDITVYVSEDDWSEANVTWDSAPAIGSAIDKIDIAVADQWYEVDVTNAVQTESNGDGILTLRLNDTDVENRTVTILTKEYGIGEFHPYLLVEGNTDGEATSVTGIDIASCPTTTMAAGYTNKLSALVIPSSATDKSVSWSSSDPSIATVDATGLVTGIATGVATVTVTSIDGGFTASCEVNVEPVDPIDIFVALGQSNMAGRAQMTSDVTEVVPNVRLMDSFGNWTDAKNPFNLYSNIRKTVEEQQVGPSYSFAQAMTKHTGKTIGMVVNAKGGTAISAFNVGGEFHDQIISRIKDLNILGTVKGIIWHQGESDSNRTGVYMGRLVSLVGALRDELGDVRFLAGQLGGWTASGESSPKYGDFNELITTIESEITNSGYVVNDDLTDFDESHFDLPSQILLGYRYAQDMLSTQYNIDISIIKVRNIGNDDFLVNDENASGNVIKSLTEVKGEQTQLVIKAPDGLVIDQLSVDGIEIQEAIGENEYIYLLTPENDEVDLDVAVASSVTAKSVTIENCMTTELPVNGTYDIDELVGPESTGDKTVTWSSSNPTVASVDADGIVTGLEEGTTSITVITAGGLATDACDIVVSGVLLHTATPDNNIIFYPNPLSSNYLNIESAALIRTVEILSIGGQKLNIYEQVNSNSIDLDLSNLDKGIFLIQIENEAGSQLKKLIKY